MTHPLSDALSVFRAAFWEVCKFESEWPKLEPDWKSAREAELAALERAYANGQPVVAKARADLAQVEVRLAALKRQVSDRQMRSDNEMDAHIATAQATLADLQGRVVKRRKEVAGIDASKEALFKRLNLN